MMPQSISLNTPPSNTGKRQRSRESRNEPSRPPSAGQGGPAPLTEEERLARIGVKMPAYLNKSKTEIQAAFQDLEWKQRYRMAGAASNSNSPFKIDRSMTVISRNRYGNVQPWENARIKLSTPIHGSDYINASPIKLRSLRHNGSQRGRPITTGAETDTQVTPFETSRYIATQGPKADQFSHFWHMVMQQSTGEVGVIIMLTQIYEGLKEKCGQYFPLDMDDPIIQIAPEPKSKRIPQPATQDDGDPFLDSNSMSSADTDSSPGTDTTTENNGSTQPPALDPADHTEAGSVELLSLTHDASIGCEVRELKVTFGDRSKTVYHYFYGSWADFGKPEAEDRVALLQLMRVSKRVAGDSPRIVHCSAGVGRTGTWIALDFLLRELEEGRMGESVAVASEVDVNSSLKVEAEAGEEDKKSKSRSRSRKPSGQKGEKSETSTSTWGKSGPPKSTTPEPKDSDVVHDTVDRLRMQRMMMVMNEIQYAFLYEALKEAFVEKYAVREAGVVVTSMGGRAEREPSPKVPRVAGEEDTVSEAETEIQVDEERGQGRGGGDAKMGDSGELGVGDDPYAAVAPENIRRGVRKEVQREVRDHEVQ